MNSQSTPIDAVSNRAKADGSGRSRVQLLVNAEANRRLLEEELSKRFEVHASNGSLEMRDGADEGFDVCIFDRPSYKQNRETLETHKERMKPIFVPYLLVCPRSDEAVISSESESVIDEIIETPIGKAKLSRRIEVLLEIRRLTLELARQREHLDEFASVVSHDLRNPLGIAQGYLKPAVESDDGDDFERVSSALNRMENIINDVLTLARTGAASIEIGTVDLSKVVKDAWKGVETAQASSDFEIDGAQVAADESRLRQLLENLFRNAIEHGGEDVTVRVGGLESGFFTEDDGPGIPEEELEHVFGNGYSTAEDGTGFGLSIAEKIADAHGWNIEATTGPDGGARFEITGVEIR